MTWAAIDPKDAATGEIVLLPLMLCHRPIFKELIGGTINGMTSDPRTVDVLCHLIAFTTPKVIVEVGTYKGIGTAAMAETLNVFGLHESHVWTCDPVDYEATAFLEATTLTPLVTVVQGTFEQLLTILPSPMDFCYIDASAKDEAGLRLRYTKLALQHMAPGGVIAVDDAAGDWKGSRTLRRMADLYLPQHRGLAILVK